MPAGKVYPVRELRGVVEATNADGAKIGEDWVSYGSYFTGERARKGDVVVVSAKGKFVESLTIVGSARGTSEDPSEGSVQAVARDETPGSTNQRIARQVALKAAVGTLSGGKALATPAAVLELSTVYDAYLNDFGMPDVDADEEAPF